MAFGARFTSEVRLGEVIRGTVSDVLSDDDLLISFNGDLLRVHNETRRPLAVGNVVTLVVKAIAPLRFQLQPDYLERRSKGRFDVSV